jgi:uncharacterized membrane protein
MPAEPVQKNYHMKPNVEAANAYFLFFISGFLILQTEKNNKFVRFHALQSIYFSISYLIFIAVINYLPLIGGYIVQLATTTFFIVWIYLIYSAYSNKEIKLPLVGDLAFEESRK